MRNRREPRLSCHAPARCRPFFAAILFGICIAVLASGCGNPERQKTKHYRKGLILAGRGRCAEAVSEYQKALKIDPRMAKAQYELGRCYAELRYDEQAIRALDAARALDPKLALDALSRIADVYVSADRPKLAQKACLDALDIDPRNVDVIMFLANLMREAESIDEAKAWFENAVAIAPDRIEPHLALADLAMLEGDYDTAEKRLKMITAGIDPDNANARLALAKVYRFSGRGKEAIEVLQRILDDSPGDIRARGALAEAYLSENRLDEARKEAEAFLKVSPASGEVHFLLGAVLLKQQDYELAVPHLTKAANSPAASADNYYLLGLALKETGRLAQAKSAFRKALSMQADNSSYRLTLAQTLLREGFFGQAQREIRLVLSDEPENERARRLWARSEALRQAFDHIDALLASKGTTREVTEEITNGLKAFRAGDLEKTQAICEGLLLDAPESPVPLNLLGLVHLKRNEFEQALSYFRQAASVDPRFAASHVNMANVYLAVGNNEQALRASRKAVELAPRDQVIRLRYIKSLTLMKRYDEVEDFLRTLIEDDPSRAAYRMSLARTLISKNEYSAARKELSQILELDPEHLPAANLLADTFAREGDAERAATGFKALVDAHPDSRHFRGMLALCHLVMDSPAKARQILPAPPGEDEKTSRDDFVRALILQEEGQYKEAEELLLALPSGGPDEMTHALMLAGVRARGADSEPFAEAADKRPRHSEAFRKSYLRLLRAESLGAADMYELNLGIGLSLAEWRRLGIARLENILRKAGPNAALLELIGGLREREGRPEKAEADYKSAVAADPSYWPAYYRLGNRAVADNRPQEAGEYFREALKYRPDSLQSLLGLAGVCETVGNEAEAIGAYREINRRYPNLASVMNNLAWLLAKNPDTLDEALEYARRAAALQPLKAEVHDTLGWILIQKGDYKIANEHLERAVLFNSIDPSIRYHRGMLFYKTGDNAKALEEFRQAETSDGRFPEKKLNEEMIRRLS